MLNEELAPKCASVDSPLPPPPCMAPAQCLSRQPLTGHLCTLTPPSPRPPARRFVGSRWQLCPVIRVINASHWPVKRKPGQVCHNGLSEEAFDIRVPNPSRPINTRRYSLGNQTQAENSSSPRGAVILTAV
ncbi:hypothetical protein JZ751_000040 [Albula glossodonta]|uniref:Uncharacterized protein n=1 Tax=Albula glossodonta TaxID=121402 RepID=A0A8T2PUP8_9TELE|nr:hypothetical protein JZ751_000040 [Albula glossodonta]